MLSILENKLILKEAAIVEQLRRSEKVTLHPTLVNTPLIYDELASIELKKLYQSYIDIALQANIPLLMSSPTWRTNQDRVRSAKAPLSINADAVHFLQTIRDAQPSGKELIKIGGLIGCKNDCYKPEEGLTADEAENFHSWQINELAKAGVDFLVCETMPNVEEAKGVAKAMEKTGLPYFISFVIARDGRVLDGTDLSTAVEMVDTYVNRLPLGYQVNCAYPSFLCADKQPAKLFERLIVYAGNGSALDHCDLDGANELEAESVNEWGDAMLELNKTYGIKILGGCCGTGAEHLTYLVKNFK